MQETTGGTGEGKARWMFVGLALALLGVAVSIYSTMHHLEVKASGQTDAACNINAQFNCDSVALSKYSEIGGVPLGVIGLGYFVALLVVLGAAISGSKAAKANVHAYVTLVLIGVVVSVVLGGISIGMLGTYCLACMGIYAVCLMQLGLVAAVRKSIPAGFDIKAVTSQGGVNAAIAVAAVIAIFNFTRPAPKTHNAATPKSDIPTLAAQAEDIPLAKSAYSGLGEDYRKGSDNAAVVIHEFADFQCPACQRITATLESIHREYGDRVLIVFRNYPLDNSCNGSVKARIHEHACNAAVMARCAGQYGKFWQYADTMFANQQEINEPKLKDWARALGLTTEQIEACWGNQDMLAKIKDDIALGNKLGVDSTPTLFVNGRKVLGGRGIAELKTEIDKILGN